MSGKAHRGCGHGRTLGRPRDRPNDRTTADGGLWVTPRCCATWLERHAAPFTPCWEQALIVHPRVHPVTQRAAATALMLSLALILNACSSGSPAHGIAHAPAVGQADTNPPGPPKTTSTTPGTVTSTSQAPKESGPPHGSSVVDSLHLAGNGRRRNLDSCGTPRSMAPRPSMRRRSCLPVASRRAGIAWMDTRLLSAQLYSGSKSPRRSPV